MGLDKAIARLVPGFTPGKTISANCGKRIKDGKAGIPCCAICGVSELLEADHCEKARAGEFDQT